MNGLSVFMLILATGIIAGATGLAYGEIGTIPECSTEAYTWELPLNVFMTTFIPTLLAFASGYIADEVL